MAILPLTQPPSSFAPSPLFPLRNPYFHSPPFHSLPLPPYHSFYIPPCLPPCLPASLHAPSFRLDIYIPSAPAGSESSEGGRNVVVFVHGGAWATGDKSYHAPMAVRMAREGAVVVAVQYSLFPEVGRGSFPFHFLFICFSSADASVPWG